MIFFEKLGLVIINLMDCINQTFYLKVNFVHLKRVVYYFPITWKEITSSLKETWSLFAAHMVIRPVHMRCGTIIFFRDSLC